MTFLNNINWRYATKKFDPTKEISFENEVKMLDSIRLAPTSFGLQPFHVTVVKQNELKAKLRAVAWNQEQLETAQFILVFSTRNDISARIDEYVNLASSGDETVKIAMQGYKDIMIEALTSKTPTELHLWASRQIYIALGFALAAAAELEIDSCPMEGFDPIQFKKILDLPQNFEPVVILPVGYRSTDDVVRAKTRFSKDDLFDTM